MADRNLVMRIMLNAQDKASAALDRIRQSGSGLAKQLTENQKALRDLDKAQRLLTQRNGLQAEMQKQSRELVENRKAQAALSAEIAKSGAPTRRQAGELANLANKGEKLRQSQAKQGQKLQELNGKLKQHGITARQSAEAQAQLNRRHDAAAAAAAKQQAALERLNKAQKSYDKAQATAGRLQSVAMGAGAGGAAVMGVVGVQVRNAISEEDAMLGVIRQVSGLKNADNSINQEAVAAVRREIQGLSAELPLATTEIMQMYEAGARMDVPRQELAAYVRTAAEAATAFDAQDMGALAENLGRINKNFKLSAEQGRELADVINYLDDNAISKGEDIIGFMNRVSGSMGLAKMDHKNTAALGSTLLTAGVDESQASGAVSSLFTRLSTAPDTKPVREALKAIGMDARTVQKGMVEDAQGTVMGIIEAVKKMPKEEQAGLLKGLAGGEYNKVFASLISNTEEWRRQIELANSEEAKGSMGREFETRMGAISSKWQVFKNRLFNPSAEAGRSLFDSLGGLMDRAGRWLELLNGWMQRNPQLVAGIVKAAAVVGVLLLAVSGLAAGLAAVILPFALLKFSLVGLVVNIGQGMGAAAKLAGVLKWVTTSLWGLSKAALTFLVTNPFGWAILAVVALMLLWRNWDKVKAALINGWEWIKNVFKDNPLIAAFTGPVGAIVGLIAHFDRFKAKATEAWQAFKRFTGIGGGASASAPAAPRPPGYSIGGYTGAGGVHEAAGIVHRGEVVFSQRDVRRFGGWQMVDKIRRGGMAALDSARNGGRRMWDKIKAAPVAAQAGSLWDKAKAHPVAAQAGRLWDKAKATVAKPAAIGADVRGGLIERTLGTLFGSNISDGLKSSAAQMWQQAKAIAQNPLAEGGLLERSIGAMISSGGGFAPVPALPGAISAPEAMRTAINPLPPAPPRREAAAPAGNTYHITVNAAAGNGQEIARAIAAELDRREAAQQRRARGRYQDKD